MRMSLETARACVQAHGTRDVAGFPDK